ncbi:MAG: hypothetical protein H0X03_08375 [Nitrosopumilus sp.]|nr:hypothetical protein [Nitrosopumilus sp.]
MSQSYIIYSFNSSFSNISQKKLINILRYLYKIICVKNIDDVKISVKLGDIETNKFDLKYENGIILYNQENSLRVTDLFPDMGSFEMIIKKHFIVNDSKILTSGFGELSPPLSLKGLTSGFGELPPLSLKGLIFRKIVPTSFL